MPPADPLKDLLELVRTAARDGVVEGLQAHGPAAPKTVAPLIDKKTLAHALSVSLATIDRLCRDERIPFVQVGDVRRFDLEAVRGKLPASAPGPVKVEHPEPPAQSATARAEEAPIPGVRLLSRKSGSR